MEWSGINRGRRHHDGFEEEEEEGEGESLR